MKLPLVVLTGPTAVGKTRLSVELARAIDGEIISADSMQVYRGLDIGSAKVSEEEKQGIPHFLIDELDPTESFDVVRFQALAKGCIKEICARSHIPILVGGTGFYIQAVLYDIDFTKTEADNAYRASLEKIAEEEGPEKLHDMLKKVDPASAALIHPNNVRRMIRALEYDHATGNPISAHNEKERQRETAYNCAYFVLDEDREKLYQRIDERVDEMMAQGLLDEVRSLAAAGCTKEMGSMQGLGYRELLAYLDGAYPLAEAVRLIKRDTRHFAKRQLTWFRRERDVIWIEKEDYGNDEQKMLEFMLAILKGRGICGDANGYGNKKNV